MKPSYFILPSWVIIQNPLEYSLLPKFQTFPVSSLMLFVPSSVLLYYFSVPSVTPAGDLRKHFAGFSLAPIQISNPNEKIARMSVLSFIFFKRIKSIHIHPVSIQSFQCWLITLCALMKKLGIHLELVNVSIPLY